MAGTVVSASPGTAQTIYLNQSDDGAAAKSTLMYVLPEDQKPFQCGLCSVSFSVSTELVIHIQSHLLSKPFQCGYCKVRYASNPELLSHMKAHNMYLRVPTKSLSALTSMDSANQYTQNKVSGEQSTFSNDDSQALENKQEAEMLEMSKAGASSCGSEQRAGSVVKSLEDGSALPCDWQKESGNESTASVNGRDVHIDKNSHDLAGQKSDVPKPAGGQDNSQVTVKQEDTDESDDGEPIVNMVNFDPDTFPTKSDKENTDLDADMQEEDLTRIVHKSVKQSRHVAEEVCTNSPSESLKYKCGECDALFKAPPPLTQHWASHHKACNVCSQSFPTPQSLQDHLKSAHGEDRGSYRPFLCGLCGASYPVARYVSDHISRVHREKADVLPSENNGGSASKTRASSSSLASVNKTPPTSAKTPTYSQNSSPKTSKTPTAAKGSTTAGKSSASKTASSGPSKCYKKKIFDCPVCPQQFNRQRLFMTHLHTVHKSHRHFKCPDCDQTFKWLHHMRRHQATCHTHSDIRPYECQECDQKFKLPHHLKFHVEAFHSVDGSRPHQCATCGLSFRLRRLLKRHSQTCPPGKEPEKSSTADDGFGSDLPKPVRVPRVKKPKKQEKEKVVCHICGVYVSYLRNHITSQHSNARPYQCTTCEKAFKTSYALRIHIRTHTNERPYMCEICGKSFLKKNNMTCHRNTHTNARPHRCEVCHKGFNCYSGLMKHRRQHTGDKRFVCNVCGMKFIASSSLKRHVLTHTDLRPLSCNKCGKTYRDRSSLRYHMVHTHNMK